MMTQTRRFLDAASATGAACLFRFRKRRPQRASSKHLHRAAPRYRGAAARRKVDLSGGFAAYHVVAIDKGGTNYTLLAGLHVGCFELFDNEGVRSITDLKGKNVGVQGLGSSQHVYAASMAAYVGLDPTRDIHWMINPSVKPMEL
jgi:ABC-type nitrate/sulfonate/bicarbonate transport system substrate-binding protein